MSFQKTDIAKWDIIESIEWRHISEELGPRNLSLF